MEARYFSGAVLTGGASRRMGTDKALVEVDGIAMAARLAAALRDAGAHDVVAIGGDEARLAGLGLEVVPDRFPGEGPLGGIVTALTAAPLPIVVVGACDMPWVGAAQIAAVVAALDDDTDVAVSASDGELQPLLGAWRTSVAEALVQAFADGERAPRHAVTRLRHRVVELGPGRWATDLDEPPG